MFEYGRVNGTNDAFQPNLVHSADATYMGQRMADKFVQLARKSTHVYTDFDRWPLVWNYPMENGFAFEQFFIVDELAQKYNHSDDELAVRPSLRGGEKMIDDAIVS